MNPNRPIQTQIIIKMPKVNDKENLKSIKKKAVSYLKGSSHKTTTDISREFMQTKRDWLEIFKVMKSKDLQPRLLYLARLSFRLKGETSAFQKRKG